MSLQQTWDKRVEGWDSHVTSAAQAALRDAGFASVTFEPVIAEAGIVSAVAPSSRG